MRRILHVDMDAFYASVEKLDQPSLEDRPVIVGADPKGGTGRGVVAACCYKARSYGVRSALPISQAWKSCPGAVYLRPRMDRYAQVSRNVMEILSRYTDLIEPMSIDEAFLDVTGSERLLGPAEEIAHDIKHTVKKETGLTASVGVAPNKFLAKIASGLRKPDGLVVVVEAEAETFLASLPISKLWGVGPKTTVRIEQLGVKTIAELALIPREKLTEMLGVWGDRLWELARGQDDRPVVREREPKSISNESTFAQDTADHGRVLRTLRSLADKVASRLRRHGYKARTLTLKLRYQSFSTHNRSKSLAEPVDAGDEVFAVVGELFQDFPLDEKIRLIGVGAKNLVPAPAEARQLSLFQNTKPSTRLSEVMDEIHGRYGDTSLRRGSELT